ncbi:MAG TPA: isocitrate lyase/PEP mutase family protein [bacterium]|nr:isocitrate lyase/PEP mutase family protein [bacterium]
MTRSSTALRQLLKRPGIIHIPIAYDALTARIAERVGFQCINLGAYSLGASLCVPEPLLCLEDAVGAASRITAAVTIPLLIDAGAGYGEPAHIVRTVREFERAGVAGIRIEDQVFPKRVHYHKGIEHLVPPEVLCDKLRYALKARTDPDFLIGARTDAMLTYGFAEGIRRANLYLEAGADFVAVFPNNLEEARKAPREINGHVTYINSEGNRLGRPILPLSDLESMGYKMANDAISAINVAAKSVKDLFETLKRTGRTGMDQATFIPVRKEIEDTIGLDEYYRIEEETVENGRER